MLTLPSAVREAATLGGDLDGDRRADLVLASHSFAEASRASVSVVRGSDLAAGGDLTLTEHARVTSYDESCEDGTNAFGDHVNYVREVGGGGGDEILILDSSCGSILDSRMWLVSGEVLAVEGSMSLETAVYFEGDLTYSSVGDMDGDGLVDIALSGSQPGLFLFSGAGADSWSGATPVALADWTLSWGGGENGNTPRTSSRFRAPTAPSTTISWGVTRARGRSVGAFCGK